MIAIVDQHGFKLVAPQRRTMIAMTFAIERGIALSSFSLLCQSLVVAACPAGERARRHDHA